MGLSRRKCRATPVQSWDTTPVTALPIGQANYSKMPLATIGDWFKYVNMADINRDQRPTTEALLPADVGRAVASPCTHRHLQDSSCDQREQMLAYVELLYFAYRDFTSDPDSILQELGFGRAHHRVLHFVHRYPGMRVAELLQILKITKQSLARVLRDLVSSGHITQQTGPSDRRERLLHATATGTALADKLAKPQIERITETLATIGGAHPGLAPHAHRDIAQKFLYHMITPSEREAVAALLARRSAIVPQEAGKRIDPSVDPAAPARAAALTNRKA
jgi:DNA-binding MarR family transcriptional regulator